MGGSPLLINVYGRGVLVHICVYVTNVDGGGTPIDTCRTI